MERWIGKVAVVTGASCGIGSAIAIDLVKAGMIVIGCARRKSKIEDLKSKISAEIPESKGELHACELDVTDNEAVRLAFEWIEKTFGGINVLINNAGRTEYTSILGDENSLEAMKRTIDTNLMGLLACTKYAFNILQKTGDYGHIVNISSICAHNVPVVTDRLSRFNIYPGSKFALRATSEIIQQELKILNKNVKISQISPGFVKTEFLNAADFPDPEAIKNAIPGLEPTDVSTACLYILGTPQNVQIQDLIIKPL